MEAITMLGLYWGCIGIMEKEMETTIKPEPVWPQAHTRWVTMKRLLWFHG